MRHAMFTAARSRLMPLTALLLATALGGCIGYSKYSSSDNGYYYPNGHRASYTRTYNTAYGYHPYYSPDYGRYNETHYSRGSGGN